MAEGKIGIVIVNYNGANYQNDALRSIYASSYTNFEVIIVDSASKDDSVELARKEYPQIHFLLQSENVGVAKGNNIGIRYAMDVLDVEYVLLINNDIELDKNTLQRLMEKADETTITVPKIYYYEPHDMLWYAGGEMYWNRGESGHIGNFETDKGQYDEEKIVGYSPTCCMLLHRNVFEKIGYIDETVFMYFDDTDLCVRLNENGYKILYVPSAFMWHKVSSSGGGMDSKVYVYYNFRNKFYFMNKYERKLSICRNLYYIIHQKKFCQIGHKSYILKPIFLSGTKYISIGDQSGIWHHARIEVLDKWNGISYDPKLEIGNHVMIGQDFHVACADSIKIEDNVLISAGVFITDLDHVTADKTKPVLEQGICTKPVQIGEGTFIGKDCMILSGVKIGKHCVIGANTVVTKDIPDYATAVGSPARVIKTAQER